MKPWRKNTKPSPKKSNPNEPIKMQIPSNQLEKTKIRPWRKNMKNSKDSFSKNETNENSEIVKDPPIAKPWRINMKQKSEEEPTNKGKQVPNRVPKFHRGNLLRPKPLFRQ